MAKRAEPVGTVVIGACQAGLASSYTLAQRGLDHVVLERGRIGEAWRGRWDSLCMVLPNWYNGLPGFPYQGAAPDGFQTRDEWVADLARYAATFALPVREGVAASAVGQRGDGRFSLRTSAGTLVAENVVVATGSYQAPRVPAIAAELAHDIHQIHSGGYRNGDALPPGAVLVVGTGNSGSQITEELHRAGRAVWLAVGYSGFPLRRYRGRDVFWWYFTANLARLLLSDGVNPAGFGNISPATTAGAPSTSAASPGTASAWLGGSVPSTAPQSRWPPTSPRAWPTSIAAPPPSGGRSMPISMRPGSTRRPTSHPPMPGSVAPARPIPRRPSTCAPPGSPR
jgi:hypothetical protein